MLKEKSNALEGQGKKMWLQTWEFFCFLGGMNSDFKGNMLYQYEQIGNEESQSLKSFMNLIYFQCII